MEDPADLEWSPAEMRAMADATVARVIGHIAGLGDAPATGDTDAAVLCRSLREGVPEGPAGLDELLRLLFDECIPRSFTTPGPGYLAYIPGGGLFPAALANLIADGANRFTGVWAAAPALVELEANALRWLRDLMGFPAEARGLFTTGGSAANWNAILCARERLGDDIRAGVMYTSSQVHHSIGKAAHLAGIRSDRVRSVPVDADFRVRVDALREAIAEDRARGLRPFLVVSTAGTTNTGAVDPLPEIADLCAAEDLWHHVDGAYGAFFHAVPELRALLPGLSRADSLTLDPHKGLFLPYGTGALLVRDGAALRTVHGAGEHPGYLPDMPDADEFYDPSVHGPDLSRGFPGLRVWMCVKLYGAARLRAAIAEKRELALFAAEAIGRLPGVVMVAPPQLSLFAFHLTWPGAAIADEDAATAELLDRVRARGRVMLTGCQAGGRFLARVCVLSFRTRRDRMEEGIAHVAEEAAALLAARGRTLQPGGTR